MIKITSCMSEAADPFCRAVARYLTERLGEEVVFFDEIPWQERLACLLAGEIDVGWICGVEYVLSTSLQAATADLMAKQSPGTKMEIASVALFPRDNVPVELLAAPVISGERYRGHPWYFSDVVVRWESGFRAFEDLRGSRWAVNEPGSFSGYRAMRYRVRQLGGGDDFFGSQVESGAHTGSLRMVMDGEADVAAIDSMVLDQMVKETPKLMEKVRVVESLGPYPAPPWVVSCKLEVGVRRRLGLVLWEMAATPRGQEIFVGGVFERLVPITDEAYDPIRKVVLFDTS